MKKIRSLAIKAIVPLSAAFTAVSVMAQPSTNVTVPDIGEGKTSFTFANLWTRIGIWVNWITALLGVAALIFLLYGAYLYMSAGQNEDNVKKAKTSVTYGVIGAVVAILAFSIFSFAGSLVG